MSAHTPGPWAGRSVHDPILIQGCDEVGLTIAFACGGGDRRRGEFVANARLIAAGPELLAALQDLCDVAEVLFAKTVGDEGDRKQKLSTAYSAIAKATQP